MMDRKNGGCNEWVCTAPRNECAVKVRGGGGAGEWSVGGRPDDGGSRYTVSARRHSASIYYTHSNLFHVRTTRVNVIYVGH